MHAIELELDETYPPTPDGFDNVAAAADYALSEAMWSYACDEYDVDEINQRCAA